MICDSGFEIWDLLVAQLSKILIIIIGPGGLRAAHVVVDGSEAGHCFHLLFSSSLSFSFPTSSAFHPLQGYTGS